MIRGIIGGIAVLAFIGTVAAAFATELSIPPLLVPGKTAIGVKPVLICKHVYPSGKVVCKR